MKLRRTPPLLLDLPEDVLLRVLLCVSPRDLCALERSCRHLWTRRQFATDTRRAAAGAVGMSLPERAAQILTTGALPATVGESFKHLLAWGVPMRGWGAVGHRHVFQSRSVWRCDCAPHHLLPMREATAAVPAQSSVPPSVVCTGSTFPAVGSAPVLLRCPAPGGGTFTATSIRELTGFAFQTARFRVRVRLSGPQESVSASAVGICPADFPFQRSSCPTCYYDIFHEEQRGGLAAVQGSGPSTVHVNHNCIQALLCSGDVIELLVCHAPPLPEEKVAVAAGDSNPCPYNGGRVSVRVRVNDVPTGKELFAVVAGQRALSMEQQQQPSTADGGSVSTTADEGGGHTDGLRVFCELGERVTAELLSADRVQIP